MSKSIKLETDASGKIIRDVLYQQDINKNWHRVAYYLYKMLSAERN